MSKKGKPQKISLADFQGEAAPAPSECSLEWARDEPNQETAENRDKIHRQVFDGKKIGAMGNFREDVQQSTKVVDMNMKAPFLAFAKNLPTNCDEELIRKAFTDKNAPPTMIKRITRDLATFAFLEFESPRILQNAILLQGMRVGHRPVTIDLATDDQRDKLSGDKGGLAGGRGQTGTKPSSPNIGRDDMGCAQRSFGGDFPTLGDRAGSSGGSGMALLDRASMGQAKQPEFKGDFGTGRTPKSPNSPGAFPGRGGGVQRSSGSTPTSEAAPGLGNWRDAPPQQQPSMAAASPGRGGGRGSRGGRGGTPTTPNSNGNSPPSGAGDGWSFRDAPAVQPAFTEKPASSPTGPAPSEKKAQWGAKSSGFDFRRNDPPPE